MRWFRRRRSKDPDQAFLDLLADHGLAAFERQSAFEERIGEPDWELDQDAGLLRLGGDLILPAQILGSASERSWTWLWAWANPSVEEALTESARAAREIGLQRGIVPLTNEEVDLDQVIGARVVALAMAGALNADAFYPCPYPGGAAYVLVEETERAPLDGRSPGDRSVDVVTRAMMEAPFLVSRRSIEAYLGALGATIDQTAEGIQVDGETTFQFDELGRLTTINTTREP